MAKKKKVCEVVVKTEACKGCYMCVEFCKPDALKISENLNHMGYYYAEPDQDNECNGCMLCVLVCPDVVIEVYDE